MPPVEKPIAKVPLMLQKMPFWQRNVGHLVEVSEGENGLSWMSFARDTLVGWLPKILVSRSLIEISESTFLEFLESGVVYFSVPLAAKAMHEFFLTQAKKGFSGDIKDHLLKKTVPQLLQDAKAGNRVIEKQLPHILAAKGATILGSMVGIGLGCEYLINYGKNLMTAHFFKKDKFSDVVNLSKGQMKSGEESQVVKKSVHRILASLGVMASTLGGAWLLARQGHRLPQNMMQKLVSHFDFDAKKGGFSLAKNQFWWYMGASIPAYADAARDKLERVESVSRLALIMGYLGGGQLVLEKGMLKVMKKFRPDLHNAVTHSPNAQGIRKVLKMSEIAEQAFREAPLKTQPFPCTVHNAEEVINRAGELTDAVSRPGSAARKALLAKNVLFGVPMVVGILGTGVGVTLLNQFWTKYRFSKAMQEAQAPEPIPPRPVAPISSPVTVPTAFSTPFPRPGMTMTGFSGYNPIHRNVLNR